VIASTSNFCMDGEGFAFKIGIDPEYARFSPGFLVEYGFLEFADRHPMPFTRVESGAQAGSYMEELWPGRVPMVSGHLVRGMLPACMFVARERLQSVREAATRVRPWSHWARGRWA
jgi:hypothetical protein